MSRYAFIVNKRNRELIHRWLDKAPDGFRVEIADPARTDAQNRLLWPLLTALSTRHEWHGQTLSPEDWKDLLSAGLKRELRIVPNLDGNGFVSLGVRTSTMTKAEFAAFIEFIYAFAAREGISLEREIDKG
jgi:hypothetical protein